MVGLPAFLHLTLREELSALPQMFRPSNFTASNRRTTDGKPGTNATWHVIRAFSEVPGALVAYGRISYHFPMALLVLLAVWPEIVQKEACISTRICRCIWQITAIRPRGAAPTLSELATMQRCSNFLLHLFPIFVPIAVAFPGNLGDQRLD